jgi:hypothetical protein
MTPSDYAGKCWTYVQVAMWGHAGSGVNANGAGHWLQEQKGWKQLNVAPSDAPRGAILLSSKGEFGHAGIAVGHGLYNSDLGTSKPINEYFHFRVYVPGNYQ